MAGKRFWIALTIFKNIRNQTEIASYQSRAFR